VLHLAQTGEHLDESVLLGTGFVLAGIAQIGMGIMAVRPGRGPYRAIVALNLVLIALYAMHVATGLPLPDAKEAADEVRGLFGEREAIEPLALVTKLAEIVGIAVALASAHDRIAVTEEEEVITRRAA
jgi:hypothetical protein